MGINLTLKHVHIQVLANICPVLLMFRLQTQACCQFMIYFASKSILYKTQGFVRVALVEAEEAYKLRLSADDRKLDHSP